MNEISMTREEINTNYGDIHIEEEAKSKDGRHTFIYVGNGGRTDLAFVFMNRTGEDSDKFWLCNMWNREDARKFFESKTA